MTVPNASNKSGPYVLDGVATVFARTFLIVDADHLAIIRTENGVKTEITTGFIIDGVGNFTGNVTISPALTGGTVTLVRRVPNSQETDYSNQAKVAPAQVENDFDLVVMQIQDLAGQIEGIDTDAVILAEIQAEAAADAAQAWAESPTPPYPLDPTSKSAKTWAGEAAASAATAAQDARFDDVATLLADTGPYTAGTVLATKTGAAYEVVASGEHFTTPGGLKVKVKPTPRGFDTEHFGAVMDASWSVAGAWWIGTDDVTAIQRAINAANADPAVKTVIHKGKSVTSQYLWLYSNIVIDFSGSGAIFNNYAAGGGSQTLYGVFAHGYYASPGMDDIGAECANNAYACTALGIGSSAATLSTLGNVSNFAIGQIVFLHGGAEIQIGAGQAKSRDDLEARRVTGINTGTGVISFDKPTRWAHATCYLTISGKAAIRSGSNEPTGHKMQVLDNITIKNGEIGTRGGNTFPGGTYEPRCENMRIVGPYGISANWVFEGKFKGTKVFSGLKSCEFAYQSHGNHVDSDCEFTIDDALIFGIAYSGAAEGLWCNQNARHNYFGAVLLRTNRPINAIHDGSSFTGDTVANNTYDGVRKIGTATSGGGQDILLQTSDRAKVKSPLMIGGATAYQEIQSSTNFEITGALHLDPVQTVTYAHHITDTIAASSGRIIGGACDGTLGADMSAVGTNLGLYIVGVEYRGVVTTKSTHPNFSDPIYLQQRGFSKSTNTYTASDGTEKTIFSNTMAAQAKVYSEWLASFRIDDTMVPTTDKTLRLYDGATLLGTLALPSAFGRARTKVELSVSSINDSTVRYDLRVTQFPFGAPGVAQVLGFMTAAASTTSTAHQPKITLEAAATATCAVTGVTLRKIGSGGGSWTA